MSREKHVKFSGKKPISTYGRSNRHAMADMANIQGRLKHPLSNFLSYNVLYMYLYNNVCYHHEF